MAAKRSPDKRERDRVEMMRLLRRGYSKIQIAERLGVHWTTISVDYAAVMREMRESIAEDRAVLVEQKRAQLQETIREAWEAWDASKRGYTRRVVRQREVRGEVVEEVSTERASTTGDPKYLGIILQAIRDERLLLGLDQAPKEDASSSFRWDMLLSVVSGTNMDRSAVDVIEGEIIKHLDVRQREVIGSRVNEPHVTGFDDPDARLLAPAVQDEIPLPVHKGTFDEDDVYRPDDEG